MEYMNKNTVNRLATHWTMSIHMTNRMKHDITNSMHFTEYISGSVTPFFTTRNIKEIYSLQAVQCHLHQS